MAWKWAFPKRNLSRNNRDGCRVVTNEFNIPTFGQFWKYFSDFNLLNIDNIWQRRLCISNCRAWRMNGKKTICLGSKHLTLIPHVSVTTLNIMLPISRQKRTISSRRSRSLNEKFFPRKLSIWFNSPLVKRMHKVRLSLRLSNSPSSAITFLYIAALSGRLKMRRKSYHFFCSFPVSRMRRLFSRTASQWPRLSSSSIFCFFNFVTVSFAMYISSSVISPKS